ncbi:MAG: ABC transporter permease [Actinomycetota bacterium]|nr:ABC transporter permease [Actinomycetota bacterium]
MPPEAGGLPAAVARRPRVLARLLHTGAGLAGSALTLLLLLVGLFAGVLAPHDPFALVGPSLGAPSQSHPMGTDALGRDLFSGVVHGARSSLLVVGAVGALVLVIGGAVGTVSGYGGGWVDDVLMRVTEFFQVLPRFFLAIVVIALFGPGLDRLALAFGLTSWAMLARVLRAEVLALKQREFVQAALAGGASNARILLREILPNALPVGIVYLGLILAQVLLLEASLGFLGLSDPNAMSWGYLAGQAQRFLRVGWWLSLFPGLAILAAVLGLNLLGDALTDVLGGRR